MQIPSFCINAHLSLLLLMAQVELVHSQTPHQVSIFHLITKCDLFKSTRQENKRAVRNRAQKRLLRLVSRQAKLRQQEAGLAALGHVIVSKSFSTEVGVIHPVCSIARRKTVGESQSLAKLDETNELCHCKLGKMQETQRGDRETTLNELHGAFSTS
jgi:hypothetical protein